MKAPWYEWLDHQCRSHLILRNLRPEGSKEYVIPKGFAFTYITCANYTFEIYGWILFGIATQTVAAFMFVAAGSFPMSQWAIGKHRRLRKVITCCADHQILLKHYASYVSERSTCQQLVWFRSFWELSMLT